MIYTLQDKMVADSEKVYMLPQNNELHLLNEAFEPLILSASGWRKVFGNGDEGTNTNLKPGDAALTALMALSFAEFVKKNCDSPKLCLGLDARPTGPEIGDIFTRVLTAAGCEVNYMFISAAPEIMAFVKKNSDINGFAYISASHNPIGHNGLKFGLGDGSVMGGKYSADLITIFRNKVKNLKDFDAVKQLLTPQAILDIVYANCEKMKNAAYKNYYDFILETAADTDDKAQISKLSEKIRKSAQVRKIGIIGELNGSARSLAPDAEVLANLNIRVKLFNDIPGKVVHRIVPEGASLDMCRELLQKEHLSDPSFLLGYVPDNDGDRGNIVYYSKAEKKALILEAQQVFALAVLAEMLFINNPKESKTAIVVNGPTSNRIERIGEYFDVTVFRAEVGEANVVNKARQLIKEGYKVRILGEGSNGGNITFPATVRDPINTIFSIIKLMILPMSSEYKNYFHKWCKISGNESLYTDDFTLDDILKSMPAYTSTSAYEPEAILSVSSPHNQLKANYEKLFIEKWEESKVKFADEYGFNYYKIYNYEQADVKEGAGNRSGKETGGFKIIFFNEKDEDLAYIWMRGSGTEPVFRVLADVKGDNVQMEKDLLAWHTAIISEADGGNY